MGHPPHVEEGHQMSVHWSKDGNTFVHCKMCVTTNCSDRINVITAGCVRGEKESIEKKLMKNKVSS
jgi:hypothetical protein